MMNEKITPQAIWDSLEIANEMPYLKARKIQSHGCKKTEINDLAIPVEDANGKIVNLQLIDELGTMVFSGEEVPGGRFHLGETDTFPIVVCVDFASGASIYENTGFHTVISFTEENLITVAQSIRGQYKEAPIIIAGEDRPSNSNAIKAAHLISARFITPEFSVVRTNAESNFNDFACLESQFEVGLAFSEWKNLPILGPTKFSMTEFALNGQSAEMRKQMLDDKYVLGKLAILGQSTVFYASPNAGKTLLTIKMLIEALAKGEINGNDVFYINADDNHKGLTIKLEIAEKYGFNMLAPNHKGFKSEKFLDYLRTLVKEGTSRGRIIILDTLKKFTNLMSKAESSEFGRAAREFVSHGGTIIALAHVNKHKNSEGKSVFQGTSDVPDDADCYYTIEVIQTTNKLKTVRFENQKSRGDVVRQVSFQYSTEQLSYNELLASVQTISEAEAIAMREIEESNSALADNKLIIDSITLHINSGTTNKTDLIKAVGNATAISDAKVKKVLDRHAGKRYDRGCRWDFEVGDKNVHTYYLITGKKEAYKDS